MTEEYAKKIEKILEYQNSLIIDLYTKLRSLEVELVALLQDEKVNQQKKIDEITKKLDSIMQ